MKPKGPSESYILSSSPHARAPSSVRDIMLDVITAVLPAIVCGIAFIWRADPSAGLHAVLVTATCVSTCILAEMLCRRAMKREQTVGDLSCVVTGLLLAATLPPDVPLWMCIAGSLFAICIAKQVFGGLGYNLFNPAAAGRAFMLISFTGAMTTWSRSGWLSSFTAPLMSQATKQGSAADAVRSLAEKFAEQPLTVDFATTATPLGVLKSGYAAELSAWNWDFMNTLFAGNINGSIGEISALALLVGGVYLLVRKVISWHVPATFLGTMALFAFFAFPSTVSFCDSLSARSAYALVHLLTGGAIIGAFYMATDMVTGPFSDRGKLVFGAGCGAITMIIRLYGAYPEGVSFAILVMNAFVPLIDRFTRPRPFGWREARKLEKAKAAAAKSK